MSDESKSAKTNKLLGNILKELKEISAELKELNKKVWNIPYSQPVTVPQPINPPSPLIPGMPIYPITTCSANQEAKNDGSILMNKTTCSAQESAEA